MTKPYHHGNLREALVEAGIAILEERGLAELSLRAIAARAGASERVHYLGGGALRDLTERVDGVVTVNSTVGLRAILDVTEPEPLPDGHPLWTTPGVVITPHTGGFVNGRLDRSYAVVAKEMTLLTQRIIVKTMFGTGVGGEGERIAGAFTAPPPPLH